MLFFFFFPKPISRLFFFYPTTFNRCWGIVFTHGVWMGRWVGGRREKVCPGCISETVRCRKLTLGRDIGWGGVGGQRRGVTLI